MRMQDCHLWPIHQIIWPSAATSVLALHSSGVQAQDIKLNTQQLAGHCVGQEEELHFVGGLNLCCS